MEAAAAADAPGGCNDEQGRRLHLAGLDAQALPALPLLQQVIGNGALLRAVLAVKSILALDHTHVRPEAQLPAGIPQGQGHIKIRHTGVLNGGIFQRGMLIADGTAGYHNVAGADIQINAAAGTDANEGIRADIGQLKKF